MLVEPGAGDRISGRYVLQETIGRGGMGVVWRAWDERLQRRVAVKCARLDDPRAAQRLMGEARNAGRLHHPHIVGVFDFVDEGATCWIVMEYVPSRSLAQLMAADGPLSPEDVGSVGCQIADALAKSHSEGVVHGDVTPENILVTAEGVARLTDFGISRALRSDATQSTTGSVRGKPRYLAPEVAQGRPPGEKADVFSLGASLFAAVEGRSPYGEADHPLAYVARAIEGRVEPARRAGPLTEPLAALLESDPRRRPDAARARRLLLKADAPVAHLRDRRTLDLAPLTLRLPRPVRRRRRPLLIAAVATASAVTAGLLLSAPWDADHKGDKAPAADAKPTTTAQAAGWMGEARTADPCKLLDAASLSRFGDTELDPDYGEIDRCDVLVKNHSGDDNADVQVNLDADQDSYEGDLTSRVVGRITVVSLKPDDDSCERAVFTADHHQIRIIGKKLGKVAPDPCGMADAATDHVVGILDDGPVPRRTAPPAADSLARVDACILLDAADLTRVPGVDAGHEDRSFGGWDCDWSGDDGNRDVEIQFSRDNALDGDDGAPVRVAGTRSYVVADEAEDDSCTVRTPHRTYTDSAGEHTVELFQLTVYGPLPQKTLCGDAAALAAAAVGNIAKQLPGK
ncbi:serine/threonine-protein kinase [Streptomyces sp. NPDC001980]|uniref:serine/threonine-protein kinase n=1 Tax=Streptomyces sp. NPDC001980 TaxID=3157126 RepID=UPI003322C320